MKSLLVIGTTLSLLLAQSSFAQWSKEERYAYSKTIPGKIYSIPLTGNESRARGRVIVINDPTGPDELVVKTRRQKKLTRYTVFLTHSPEIGKLPAQFIGEYETDKYGRGLFKASTEVVNAFASANQSLADESGVADVIAAGALGLGANTIPLNHIRIYEAAGSLSVFGASDEEVGGGLGLSSVRALP